MKLSDKIINLLQPLINDHFSHEVTVVELKRINSAGMSWEAIVNEGGRGIPNSIVCEETMAVAHEYLKRGGCTIRKWHEGYELTFVNGFDALTAPTYPGIGVTFDNNLTLD